ncbi:MAG TPA: late competence development ComFB family protein [Spirochaetia bacterium]
MSLKDFFDFDGLVNEAEILVVDELERQLSDATDICRCKDCVLDMAALALNNVRPSYRVSLLGSVYARSGTRSEYAQEITRAVRQAIDKVSANPSHD